MITLTSLKRSQVIRKAKLHIVQQTHRNSAEHSYVNDRSLKSMFAKSKKYNRNDLKRKKIVVIFSMIVGCTIVTENTYAYAHNVKVFAKRINTSAHFSKQIDDF